MFFPFQGVPRIWRPAIECSKCSYPNDDCFRFCQQCGSKRGAPLLHHATKRFEIDIQAIDARIREINSVRGSRAYEKQKSQLEVELDHFLESLPCPKTLLSASPQDVLRFLVWKDCRGRTQVHVDQCPYAGQAGRQPCHCPIRLSAGTVDSVIGKLRSIFNCLGRSDAWDDFSCRGNPVVHHSIKSYLKSIQLEQAQARTPSKQATPLFLDKFYKLVCHLRGLLQNTGSSTTDKYIFARDLAFFALSFSTGGRASDVGRIKTIDILQDDNGQNFLIHQRIGKTLRGSRTRAVPVRSCANPAICPVQNLRFYVKFCKAAGINLCDGYLFRTTTPKGLVTNSPFLISAVRSRLVTYLTKLGIYEGETPHSFRSGTAILLRLLGATKEEVAHHIGWQSTQMVDLYTQTGKVMGSKASKPTPASNPINIEDEDLVEKIGLEFREKNLLVGFKPAFV